MRRFVLAMTLVLSGASLSARTEVAPPTLASIANIWVGGEGSEYLRLELKSDGTGLLTVQYLPQNPAVAYRVKATKIDKYKLHFALVPFDQSAEPIYLRGTGSAVHMNLEIGGAGKWKWKRQVALEHYSRVMARIQAVNERAAAFKAQNRTP